MGPAQITTVFSSGRCECTVQMPLESQSSRDVFQIVFPIQELEPAQALSSVHYSIKGLRRASEDTCEADDAAHVPRGQQRAEESQALVRHVLRRHHLLLTSVIVQFDCYAVKGGEYGTSKDSVKVGVLRGVCERGGVS